MTIQPQATQTTPLALGANLLRPYVSALILEDRLAHSAAPNVTVATFLAPLRRGGFGRWALVAEGRIPRPAHPDEAWAAAVFRTPTHPAWASEELDVSDVVHQLVMVRTKGRLTAVHGPSGFTDAVLRALKQGVLGRFRRIDPDVLESSLIVGDTRALHLRGAHRPRRTKADVKALRGAAVQEALNPTEDGSFYVTAAQVGPVPGIPDGTTLGVTPTKSRVWIGPSQSFEAFDGLLDTLLSRVERALATPTTHAYGVLAHPRASLGAARTPIELVATAPDRLAADASAESIRAARLLGDVEFEVEAACNRVDFRLRGLRHGRQLFRTVGRFSQDGWETRLRFVESSEIDPESGAEALQALRHEELLSVHFLSGETWDDGRVIDSRAADVSFPNWRWGDFTGVDVTREKPGTGTTLDRQAVGEPGDDSLFGWVVRTFGPEGYLTCDDGAGEIADFVCVDGDGGVRLIHVKGAGRAKTRRIAVQPYEVVTAQAEKNTRYARLGDVCDALAARPAGPTWEYGTRRDTARAELLEFLAACDRGRPVDVDIVQPHVTRSAYLAARDGGGTERARLNLLDWHLHATRRVITGAAGDLTVWGDAS